VRVIALEPGCATHVDDVLLLDARGVQRPAEPRVDLAAGAQHDVRGRQRLHIVRADLVLVRVGVGRKDRGDLRSRGDVAGEVGELRGRRDDGRTLARARPRTAAARGGDGEQKQQQREAANHEPGSLLKLIPIFSKTA
jgi:hypothetical protein